MKQSSKRLTMTTMGSSSSMCAQLQQMLTLLLMVIALCASRIASSPTQPQQQQQQKQLHPQQQQQLQMQEEQQKHQTTTIRVQQCREGCLEKFAAKNPLCQQTSECSTCWDECSRISPSKISKSIRETWSLHTVSMIQQDSLVLVDVAWDQMSVPYQCLVTWEVSGGGLMGNLLTESFSVQLSLWPDTKYRVQVTCKNKLSGLMSRSLPLAIDTSNAIRAVESDADAKIIQKPSLLGSLITKLPLSPVMSATTTMETVHLLSAHDSSNGLNTIDSNVVPYDYALHSGERKDHETSFILNWNIIRKNGDISSVEPMQQSEQELWTMLANAQRPLLFGMTGGLVLIIFLLLICTCPLQSPRISNDKAMLIAEDLNVDRLTVPPVQLFSSKFSGVTPTPSSESTCKSPATCSRHTPRV
ncbi:uncharacterized protein LOC106084608 [Stomoxys calcitrans]|uniref:uncharacterized protein LOC106084608 n=1 Tax=Stomoxys calcitrans TaxID=35570 RepID=UPI0027E389CF|nr:uncharacterized protein LOC106084608 [Stomoxys calcitrans]